MAFHTVEDGPWPQGVTVAVYPVGSVDVGSPIDTAIAQPDGTATFGGLTEGGQYTAVGSGGTQTFVAQNQEAAINDIAFLVAAPTGDGDTDTANYIATKALAVAAGGGVVQFRRGEYKISSFLALPSYLTLRGAGKYATRIKCANGFSSSVNMLQLANAQTEMVALENLMLDGNFASQHGIYLFTDSLTSGAFASGLNNSRHRINNVLVRNTGGNGFHMAGDGRNGIVHANNLDTYFCQGYGYYVESSSDSVFMGGDVGQSGLTGVRDIGTSNRYLGFKSWLSGRVDATANGDGYRVTGSSIFVGCDAQDNGRHGVSFFNATNAQFSGKLDTNGTRTPGEAYGADMRGATNCRVDIIAFDRKGDSGTDPLVQDYAVNIGSGTGNVIAGVAGLHAIAPIPTADWLTDNIILLQQNGTLLSSKLPHSTISHVDSISISRGTTRKVENIDRLKGGISSVALVNGTVEYMYFYAPFTGAMTKLGLNTRGTAQVGATLMRIGLYTVAANGDLTLVARTANDTSILAATFTPYEIAMNATGGFVTTYTLLQGVRYAFGIIQVGAATPGQAYGSAIPGVSDGPILAHKQAGQTDLPTSVLFGSLSSEGSVIWMKAAP